MKSKLFKIFFSSEIYLAPSIQSQWPMFSPCLKIGDIVHLKSKVQQLQGSSSPLVVLQHSDHVSPVLAEEKNILLKYTRTKNQKQKTKRENKFPMKTSCSTVPSFSARDIKSPLNSPTSLCQRCLGCEWRRTCSRSGWPPPS